MELLMRAHIKRTIAGIHRAALAPRLWPGALEAVATLLDAAGAAYIALDKQTGQVDWACFSGPSADMVPEYIGHYAALDPYAPMLEAAPAGRWKTLSECLPQAVLRRDEWYNDFVLRAGVGDILGARLVDRPSHSVVFGVHLETGRGPLAPESMAALNVVAGPLRRTAELQTDLHSLGWQGSIALHALERMSAAVIIAECDGQLIEMNRAAERIAWRNDGLSIRNGRVAALGEFASTSLRRLLAGAGDGRAVPQVGHVVARRGGRLSAYSVTVVAVPAELNPHERPVVMLIIAEPGRSRSRANDEFDVVDLPATERRPERHRAGRQTSHQAGAPAVTGERYYFHICNGRTYADDDGTRFSTPDRARAHASVIAAELATDGGWTGYTVLLHDKQRNEIARFPIAC
jgi:hypothetical protein